MNMGVPCYRQGEDQCDLSEQDAVMEHRKVCEHGREPIANRHNVMQLAVSSCMVWNKETEPKKIYGKQQAPNQKWWHQIKSDDSK